MPTGSHPLAGQERLWEPLLPAPRERLPLPTFGPYEPDQRAGPASWLRCMIALAVPDDASCAPMPFRSSTWRASAPRRHPGYRRLSEDRAAAG